MAAGSAGASLFSETLRPWLLWISAACAFDEASFLREFAAAAGETRLVVLLSPT